MSEHSFNPGCEDNISLKEILDFLFEYWKLIVINGLLGVLISAGFLIVTPNQYQATAQIQMAQIQIAQISANNNPNPLGVNIEDPNLLIARSKLPSTYSVEVIKACGFDGSQSPAEDLVEALKFHAVKGAGSMIELKINRDSKEVAINCAQALFESIKTSQNQIIKPYVEESKALLVKYESRLANSNSQSLVPRADKSDATLSTAYLGSRDEVKFLNEEILRLNAFITTSNTRQAKLFAPIYAADAPVFPKKKISLIVGLMGGLLLGLLLAVVKRALKS